MNEALKRLMLGGALVLPLATLAQDVATETMPAAESPPADAPAAEAAVAAEASAPLDTVPVEVAEESKTPDARRERTSGSRLVEEIVVTAQKREENIQDVPIAISAFSPAMLDAVGVETVQDLERATPGLTITNAAGYSVAYLRGVGTDAFLAGADPSVPFYLDGVALLGTQGSSDTLGRVKRVEVTKGPQGTLFGRNATGGAISIITPDPDGEFSGDLKLEFGKFDETNGLAYANIPMLDNLAFSVAAFYNTHDNYYKNDGPGGVLDIYSRGFRTKARWDVTDNFALIGAYSYAVSSNNAGLTFENTRVAPALCPGGACLIQQDPKADRRINSDQVNGAVVNSRLTSLTATWSLPWLDLKFIGSDQTVDAPFVQADFDASPMPLVGFTSIQQIATQKTAELQFISNADTPFSDRFEWVGGLYFIQSDGGFDPLAFNAAPNFLNTLPIPAGGTLATALDSVLAPLGLPTAANGLMLNSHGVSDAESISAYFQGTYGILETLDLTIGARYQEEKRDLKNGYLAVANADGSETIVREDNVPTLNAYQLSPKVAFQWRPFDELSQIYLSWSRGFKSPTYNTVNFVGTPEAVDEEQVDSYELGFKSDLFDANLRLNAAAFFIQQKDLLTGFVALASGGVVTYDNAGDSEIKGVEADFVLTPFPGWNPGFAMTGSATVLDTKYTDYKDGRGFDEETGLAFGEGSITGLPARDFTGNDIVRSPKLSYALGLNQSLPLGPGNIEFGADVYYNDGFFFLPQNSDLYARDSYALFNARVSYFYDPWGLQFTAFGENLSDETYNEVVFVADFGRNQVLNNPRVYGVRVAWTF